MARGILLVREVTAMTGVGISGLGLTGTIRMT
jgi:hypothetical protein